MTLLQQIQNECIDTSEDVAPMLRRCRILAQRLAVDEFKNWVVWELEGYPSEELLPAYRIISTPIVLGQFTGPFGARIENAQIPLLSIPTQLRDRLTKLPFMQGVGGVTELLRNKTDSIRIPWPADVLRFIGQGNIYKDLFLVEAIRYVSLSSIRDILDQVQNRVLNFVLELESRNPEAGEAIMKSTRIPEQQVRNIFNNVIQGNVQNLAQASHHLSQTAREEVVAGDLKSLKRNLAEIGLEEAELEGLEIAIERDKKAGAKGMGDKVMAWLGKVAIKASTGAISVASTAGTTAITEAIKRYFGH